MTTKYQVIYSFLLCLILLSLAAPGAVFAGQKAQSLTVEIDGPEEEALSFSIAGDFVGRMIGGLLGKELVCNADLDADTMAMLRHLDRHGEGSRYTLEIEDQVVKARRRKGQLELTIHEDGHKEGAISMPWSIAACMMGDETALQTAKGDGVLQLVVEDEGTLTIRIE